MDIKQLRYFLAVAQELNFTRAAEKLFMAQPPLSQQIMGLEEELGVALFRRSNRHVELTAAGEALLLHARRVLNAASEAVATVHAVRDGRRGNITVGAVHSAIYTLLPETLAAFARSHPDVDVDVREMAIHDQVRALREGVIDLAILRGPLADPEFFCEPLYGDPMIAVLPASTALAGQRRVSLKDLAELRLIAISEQSNRHYSDMVSGMFEKAQCMPQSLQSVTSMHNLLCLVGAGIGFGIVPLSTSAVQLRQVVFRPLVEKTPLFTLTLAWRKNAVSLIVPELVRAVRAAAEDIVSHRAREQRAQDGRPRLQAVRPVALKVKSG